MAVVILMGSCKKGIDERRGLGANCGVAFICISHQLGMTYYVCLSYIDYLLLAPLDCLTSAAAYIVGRGRSGAADCRIVQEGCFL